MTTPVIPAEVAAFAASVRAELADLTEEEVEELTGGLEADLSEAYADDLRRELPDPVEYAVELRAAADLPPRGDGKDSPGWFAGMADDLRRMREETTMRLRQQPAVSEVLDILVALRPVWWLVRAVVAVTLIGLVVGVGLADPLWCLGLLGASVVSIQWGRGVWGGRRLRGWILAGNVVAALFLVPGLAMAGDLVMHSNDSDYYSDVETSGVTSDGAAVSNIFPYDADGKPLTGVQLFDQDGLPLDTTDDTCDGCLVDDPSREGVPTRLETGEEVRNVYPLSFRRLVTDEFASSRPSGPTIDPVAPFAKAPATGAASESRNGSSDAPDRGR